MKEIQLRRAQLKSHIQDSFVNKESTLEKANHKYFKREGSPGNYKYYYTEEEYKKSKGSTQQGYKITGPMVKWLDAHDFTTQELSDHDYVSEKIHNYAEQVGIHFTEQEAVGLVKQYQKIKNLEPKTEKSGESIAKQPRSSEDDQRINLIEKLIKLGFSPEEAREKVGKVDEKKEVSDAKRSLGIGNEAVYQGPKEKYRGKIFQVTKESDGTNTVIVDEKEGRKILNVPNSDLRFVESKPKLTESQIRQAIAESGKMTATQMISYIKSKYPGRYDEKMLKENAKELAADIKK